ncbi:alpha/beta fold hydrolase [Pseudenhygromyxa sp. WMMC2535]|uniref:alpha/beta fold hydrolase n=1 Tax=Pseudenhygromyxa sp. WMMC2535 TaxID=2712867 RepID=UPI0015547D0B|nr:alpha/beta fold hydrolase [Pseudenhygromyxa sp. WMMC2535]NVB41036.1 alpha/beta fold hydrolase [Pseudenhygromyxa sp. WMMC2535]
MDDLAFFPPETQTFVGCLFSGLRMRWYERGPQDAPVVLCLHGFPELAVSWREQLAGLSDRYRVIAPDMRGYGGTDAPPRVRDYDMDLLVRDVVELIDAVGVDKVHLVGHDWGGAVAWAVAQHHGERLHSLSVLNCPPAQLLVKEFRRLEQLRRSWYMFFFQLPFLPERVFTRDPEAKVRELFHDAAYNPEPFTTERMRPYVRQLRERGLPGLNYYRAALRRLPRPLASIEVPTRLIWGLQDHALGPWFAEPERYTSWIRDFDRVLIDAAGHWVNQEAAAQVNAALREHFERVTGVEDDEAGAA